MNQSTPQLDWDIHFIKFIFYHFRFVTVTHAVWYVIVYNHMDTEC